MNDDIAKAPPADLFTLETDMWTEPFWAAARDHRLVVCRCAACGQTRFPPGPYCPACRSQQAEWPELPGTGEVFAYTVVSRSIVPEMDASIPYVPAVIALDGADGCRIISNVVGCPVSEVAVGSAVQVEWEDRADGATIPRFRMRRT
ncbi:Zn-ribbon domain-containing OB-fold protein [Phytohabitans kaempferiae]|uniref:Zn-ribbon domain-containing OB-fold protein n=1 Tax=Phytohabitans kaempferiae TaxID=1620943 RepID=A0ABV6M4Z4_9ACTN